MQPISHALRPYPGDGQYETCHRQRPSGGAIGAAAARSPARRIARMSPARICAWPAATTVPTIERTIWWQKAVGLDLEAQHPLPEVGPPGPADPSHQRHRLLARRRLRAPAERAEVVLAEERIAGQREQLEVERHRHVPRGASPGTGPAPVGSAPCSGRCGRSPRSGRRSRAPPHRPRARRWRARTASPASAAATRGRRTPAGRATRPVPTRARHGRCARRR